MSCDDARLAAEIVDALVAPSEAYEAASNKLETVSRNYVEEHGLVSDDDCLIAAGRVLASIYPEDAERLRRFPDSIGQLTARDETTLDVDRATYQLLHVILLYVSAFGRPRVPRSNVERLLRRFPRTASESGDDASITFIS
jgi:hypothetical protein